MIELNVYINARAIPLEPGQRYIVLVNSNEVSQAVQRKLASWAESEGVKCVFVLMDDMDAIRVIGPEDPK